MTRSEHDANLALGQAQPAQSWLKPSTCRRVHRKAASATPVWIALASISSALFIVITSL